MSNLTIAEPVTLKGNWRGLRSPPKLGIPKPLVFDSPAERELLLPSTQLPLEDNEPLETNQHRIAMNALIRSLKHHWAVRTDFIVGGNMFVYFSPTQARTHDYRGPDFFVALDVDGSYSRPAWIAWEEKGKLPDVIIELLSSSTAAEDVDVKKDLYERIFKTTDYFVFDPFDVHSLRGWHLSAPGWYEELTPNAQGRLWSAKLELWVGVWDGAIENESRPWLRFYDTQGQLVPLPEEAAKREAQEASQRAERLAEQLRRLGFDPDRLM
jgi:Uma2 family endonuclease